MHEISKRRARWAALVVLLSGLISSHGCRQAFVSWLVRDVTLDTAHFSGGAHFGQKSITLDPGGVDVIRWSGTTNPTQAGDVGMNVTSGQLQLFDNGALNTLFSTSAFYGDGFSGACTLDGSTVCAGMTPSANVYSAPSDLFFTNLTVNSGISLGTNNFRIFVSGTLNLVAASSTIANNGSNGGATCAAGFYANDLNVGAGASGASSNGTQPTQITASFGPLGGTGGTGGASGQGQSGGAGGTSAGGGGAALHDVLETFLGIAGAPVPSKSVAGGTGGGSGGAGATSTGGAGGGGGCVVFVAARVLKGAGQINAPGGNGGAGTGSNGGGGGGGGGGLVVVLTTDKSGWTGTLTAAGGSGGGKTGTGSVGATGNAGATALILGG